MKKQMKLQRKRQKAINKSKLDISGLGNSSSLDNSNDSGVISPNHKLPRLVKLNPGMNTMSLSFKPTMSLSLTGEGLSRNDSGSTLASLSSFGDRQSDETLDLNSSADEVASDSTSSNASSKKSSTSTITR